MYHRLKNLLGASLMILAVVLSQIPMPEAQAEETSTVTFSMNGGEFNGEYNGYNFKGQTPVLVLDNNKAIENYPDDQYASYAGYETEKGKWYTDKACLEEFDTKSRISESVTIYKKWYSTEDGFCLNPDKTVLYGYSGDQKLVQIPDSVKTIAPNAFESIANVRGIVMPKEIETVYDNAFSGASRENSIIYIYDNDSSQSKQMAQKLAESYEQFVYSSYLDIDKVEEIAGIDYDGINNPAEKESESTTENDNQADTGDETKTEESSGEQKETETETETETKTEEVREYVVIFDTGISGVTGEKRSVPAHSTVSELVSISGEQPKILTKGSYTVASDDGKQEITYTFDGWYKDSGCTKEWDFASDTIESDTTIYAKWDRKMKPYFYVTFVAEGASNVPDKVKLYEDEPLNEPSKKPSIKDRTFKGWYTDEEDSETKFVTWGKPLSGNLTLYAQWETKGYTVTFNMNGGKYSGTYDGKEYNGVTSVRKKIEKGNGIAKNAYPEYNDDAVFKYSGYNTDSNWYTDKNCLSIYGKTNSNGRPKEVKKDITLYKKWYATTSGFTMNAKKTVLYKYNGGAGNVKIPETVTVIGEDAFTNISSIKSVALPDVLTDVDEDAFSGFERASKDVTITAKSDSAIAIAKELASKYKHLVYEKDSDSSNQDKTKSDSVSVVNANDSGAIALGAVIGGNTGTAKTVQGTGSATTNTTSAGSTGVTLGASGAPASGIGANSVTVGGTNPTAPAASQVPTASDAIAASGAAAAQKSAAGGGSSASTVSKTKTTSKTNAAAASAPSGAQHVKDSTPKTGDPIQYRMLFVCVLFSAGVLIVLTGNGKRRKFSPS